MVLRKMDVGNHKETLAEGVFFHNGFFPNKKHQKARVKPGAKKKKP